MRNFITKLTHENVELTAYLLLDQPGRPELSAARPVMLVCPGGGYTELVPHEDENIALFWAARGYNTFTLHYTVNKPGAAVYALQDVAEAVATIRKNASDWHCDAHKIAIIGFSAGAHLCATLAVRWNDPSLAAFAKCPSADVRPDAAVVCYVPDNMHMERRSKFAQMFFDKAEPTEEDLTSMTPSDNVAPDSSPMFLMHTFEDQMVDVHNSIMLAKAYADKGVPFELHIFEKGRHGVNLANELMLGDSAPEVVKTVSAWPSLAANWLALRFGI